MLAFWISLSLIFQFGPHTQTESNLKKGLRAENKGQYKNALKIWERARKELETPDPGIGREYIRLATEQQIEEVYQKASEMYYWGLSAETVEGDADVLNKEIQFINPFLEPSKVKRLEKMVREEEPGIYAYLEGFWRSMDPTPMSEFNERLLEHWERIAYVRSHFDRRNETVYGTDDRAIPYIKYGAPDVKRSGTLIFNSSKAANWVQDIIISGTQFTAEAMKGGSESRYYKYIEGFVQKAREFYTAPEYEIWVYGDLQERRNNPANTIFIFGSNAETGEYGIVESVEDFIPGKAFSSSSSNLPTGRAMDIAISNSGSKIHGSRESMGRDAVIDNIRPGLLLQMMYYDQLSSIDAFFGDSFEKLHSRATDRGPVSTSLGREKSYEHRNQLLERRLRSINASSEYTEAMREIPVVVYQYRMLDGNNKPYLQTFVRTRPQEAYLIDYLYNYDPTTTASLNRANEQKRRQSRSMTGRYELMHGIRVFGEDMEPLSKKEAGAEITTVNGAWSETTFEVPHIGEDARQIFAAELYNRDQTSSYKGSTMETLFPSSLRGRGKIQVEQPSRMGNETELQMGDLILGYDKIEIQGSDVRFPFHISHEKVIPEGEALVLHLEVYNLEQDTDGITDFSLSYELMEPTEFMKWLRGRYKTNLELTLNQQTETPDYTEDLEIETRDLEPGTYRLQISILDNHSGREIEKAVEFRIE